MWFVRHAAPSVHAAGIDVHLRRNSHTGGTVLDLLTHDTRPSPAHRDKGMVVDLVMRMNVLATPPLILVVDTHAQRARQVQHALLRNGYRVEWCADSVDALISVEENQPALVVLNWNMPFITGDIIMRAMQTGLRTPPPVVALIEAGEEPLNPVAGVKAFLRKPPDLTLLVRLVDEAVGRLNRTPSQ